MGQEFDAVEMLNRLSELMGPEMRKKVENKVALDMAIEVIRYLNRTDFNPLIEHLQDEIISMKDPDMLCDCGECGHTHRENAECWLMAVVMLNKCAEELKKHSEEHTNAGRKISERGEASSTGGKD